MSLHWKRDDWRLKQLDVGWHYLESEELVPFTDKLDSPVLGALDGQGGKATDQTDPAMRYFKEFEDANFPSFLRVSM